MDDNHDTEAKASLNSTVTNLRVRKEVDYRTLGGNDQESIYGKNGQKHFKIYFLEKLKELFTHEEYVDCLPSSQFTLDWVRHHSIKRPIKLEGGMKGLGMKIPHPRFTVHDVATTMGKQWPVAIIDVAAQQEIHWTLGKWAEYFHAPPEERKKVLNLISLEFSGTPLHKLVRSPKVIRQIDWIDHIWPGRRRQHGEYPQVQYYCLMSLGESWTDFHLDFGGTSVWYHVHTGRKIFIFLPPTEENLRAFENWTTSSTQSTTFFPDTITEGPSKGGAFYVTLEQGGTLIIPTGWIHAVYTPVDSLVFGGNFLHGYDMYTQLRIYKLELETKVPRKYRFPYYEHLQWYAAAYYTQFTRLSQFSTLYKQAIELLQQTMEPSPNEPEKEHESFDQQSLSSSSLINKETLYTSLHEIGLSIYEIQGLPFLLQTLKRIWTTIATKKGISLTLLTPTNNDMNLPVPLPSTESVNLTINTSTEQKESFFSTETTPMNASVPSSTTSSSSSDTTTTTSTSTNTNTTTPTMTAKPVLKLKLKLSSTNASSSSSTASDAPLSSETSQSTTASSTSSTTSSSRPAPRTKGAIIFSPNSETTSLSFASAEDEQSIFPPSAAATEGAAMVGYSGENAPELLLQELENGLFPPDTSSLSSSSSVTVPLPSLLKMHATDPALRTVEGSFYNIYNFSKGSAVNHMKLLNADPAFAGICTFGLYHGAVPGFAGEPSEEISGSDIVVQREEAQRLASILGNDEGTTGFGTGSTSKTIAEVSLPSSSSSSNGTGKATFKLKLTKPTYNYAAEHVTGLSQESSAIDYVDVKTAPLDKSTKKIKLTFLEDDDTPEDEDDDDFDEAEDGVDDDEDFDELDEGYENYHRSSKSSKRNRRNQHDNDGNVDDNEEEDFVDDEAEMEALKGGRIAFSTGEASRSRRSSKHESLSKKKEKSEGKHRKRLRTEEQELDDAIKRLTNTRHNHHHFGGRESAHLLTIKQAYQTDALAQISSLSSNNTSLKTSQVPEEDTSSFGLGLGLFGSAPSQDTQTSVSASLPVADTSEAYETTSTTTKPTTTTSAPVYASTTLIAKSSVSTSTLSSTAAALSSSVRPLPSITKSSTHLPPSMGPLIPRPLPSAITKAPTNKGSNKLMQMSAAERLRMNMSKKR